MNRAHEIIKIIFAAAAMLYFILQLCFMGLWKKNILKKAGELILKTSGTKRIAAIVVLILCPLLILFSLITKATFFVCCLMSVVAALACFINCRELVYGKINGIYSNGIVGGGRFTKFDDIETFPDTLWKEPEKQETVSLAIQLKTEGSKKAQVYIIDYPSIVEYVHVVNKLKEIKQNK